MNQTKDISEQCVLVKLSVGTYAGNVKCDKLSKEAAATHGADEDAISTVLKAMDPADRKDIMAARSEARAVWIGSSLPWEDNGMRLVPVGRYLKTKDALEVAKAKFEDAVQAAVGRYDEIAAKVHKRLNGLTPEVNFPDKAGFAGKFRFNVRTSAVSRASDIRLASLPAEEVEKIKASQEASVREQLFESQRDVLARVSKKLAHVVKKLEECNQPNTDKHFKDSLLTNVWELCDEMQGLNVVGSVKLDETLKRISDKFGAMNPDAVRESRTVRNEVKQVAADTIDELDNFQF